MSWQTYYKEHTLTAEEAVGKIRSGDRVVLEHACGEPVYLVDKMVENAAAMGAPAPKWLAKLLALGRDAVDGAGDKLGGEGKE